MKLILKMLQMTQLFHDYRKLKCTINYATHGIIKIENKNMNDKAQNYTQLKLSTGRVKLSVEAIKTRYPLAISQPPGCEI